MTEKVKFLCGNYKGTNFIYGVTFADYDWYYFEEQDTISSDHKTLPDRVHFSISALSKATTIEIQLNPEQLRHYFRDGKFIYKNKELKTRK